MKDVLQKTTWRTRTRFGAVLIMSGLTACSGQELLSRPHDDNAGTQVRAGEVGKAAPVQAPGDVDMAGSEGLDGPVAGGVFGWRAKGPGTESTEIGREHARAVDLPARVQALIGRDPFVLATVAGEVAVRLGLDAALAARLRGRDAAAAVVALVMPALPAQVAMEDVLQNLGAEVLGMASPQTYVVKATPGALRAMAGNELVYWVGQVPWDRKIDPSLARGLGLAPGAPDAAEMVVPGAAVVALYDGRDAEVVRQAVEDMGAVVESYDPQIAAFVCTGVSAGLARRIGEIEEVSFVDAHRMHHVDLDTSVDRSGNHDYIRDTYTYGANIPVGIIDSGVEIDHQAFLGWSPYPPLYARAWNVSGEGSVWDDNPSGHGTHVAGIMLSRWLGTNLDGMAPRTGGDTNHRFRLVRTGKDSGNSSTVYNTNEAMDLLAADDGAEVINCSWSNNSNTGTNSSSIKADSVVWDQGQIYVFAAGNDGTSAGSIDSPGAAKNVIAVGSLDNASTLGLSYYSSEGPTADNRIKPDIYAPGRWIDSANSGNLSASVQKSGTSMAAPHVTGFLATLLDHYPDFVRRPALTKAYLMASAARKSGLNERTGALNSYQAHFSTSTTGGNWGWRDTDSRAYSYIYWDVTVPSGVTELYVVLSWVEPAAFIGSSKAVYNDVDLWVDYNRDANGYGEWASVSGADNVEFVKILNPPAGNYRINARNYSTPVIFKSGFGLFYKK